MLRMAGVALFFALLMGIPASGVCLETPKGMFDLYEQNQAQGIPNYITEDFILLAYGMILNEAVTEMEEGVLYPEFAAFISDLTKKLESENDPDEIVTATLAYLNVLACLLSGTDKPQNMDDKAVVEELTRIRAAQGIAPSALMKQQIDYSQFKVRGKYTRNPHLPIKGSDIPVFRQFFPGIGFFHGFKGFPVGDPLSERKLLTGDNFTEKPVDGI